MKLDFDGRDDHYTFVDSGELRALVSRVGLHDKENFRGAWYGDCDAQTAIKRLTTGDESLVAASDHLLSKLEDALPHTKKFQWQRVIAGQIVDVPEMLRGEPACMRRRVRARRNDAPVTIFMDLTSSAMIAASDLLARGTAILALARALVEHRAVELWGGVALGERASSRHGGRDWASTVAWRIDTAPLDLARAAFLLAHPAVARGIGYGLGPPCANHATWNGSWPFGDHTAHVSSQSARLRNALGASELLVIPPIYGLDPLVRDPLGWITRELHRLTDPDSAASVGSEQWNKEADHANAR
jgi:hypothetical protein